METKRQDRERESLVQKKISYFLLRRQYWIIDKVKGLGRFLLSFYSGFVFLSIKKVWFFLRSLISRYKTWWSRNQFPSYLIGHVLVYHHHEPLLSSLPHTLHTHRLLLSFVSFRGRKPVTKAVLKRKKQTDTDKW